MFDELTNSNNNVITLLQSLNNKMLHNLYALEDEFENYFLGLNEIKLDLRQNPFKLPAKNDDIQIKFLELKSDSFSRNISLMKNL